MDIDLNSNEIIWASSSKDCWKCGCTHGELTPIDKTKPEGLVVLADVKPRILPWFDERANLVRWWRQRLCFFCWVDEIPTSYSVLTKFNNEED